MEGKLRAQAEAPGVAGARNWKDLTDNVNMLAANLTSQVKNFTEATTAVVGGDLSQEIMLEAAGEVLGLESTINNMMDFLNRLTDEVSRVAQVAGAEEKLRAGGERSEKTPNLLSQTHLRLLACDNCRGDLELTRYEKNGGYYRKYTCPQCGFTAVYKRRR